MLIKIDNIKHVEDKKSFCVWLYLEYVNSSLDIESFTNTIEVLSKGDIFNPKTITIENTIKNGKEFFTRGYNTLSEEKVKEFIEL